MLSYKTFDKVYKAVLNKNKLTGIVQSRHDLENIPFEQRVTFIKKVILKHNHADRFIYKISFWDNFDYLNNILTKNIKDSESIFLEQQYNNAQEPGVVFIQENHLNLSLISETLQQHFNFEQALSPSINCNIMLSISHGDDKVLFNFYDDRGFDIYYYT